MNFQEENITFDQSMVKYGGFWIRLLARLIDSAIFSVISIVAVLIFYLQLGINSLTDITVGVILFIVLYIIAYALYFIVMNAVYGKTLGKIVTGLIIRREEDLGKLTIGKSIGRFFALEFISNIALGLGYLWAAWDPQKQSWHDKLARTVVVYENTLVKRPTDIIGGETEVITHHGPIEMRGRDFAELIMISGLMRGKHTTLRGKNVIIGRSVPEVHVPIKDPEKLVSRIQFEIFAVDDHLYKIRNRSSRNTTQLNGRRITSEIPLRSNDVISFGSHSARIVFF